MRCHIPSAFMCLSRDEVGVMWHGACRSLRPDFYFFICLVLIDASRFLHHVLGNTHRNEARNTWTNLWRKTSERWTCHREQNDLKAERVLGIRKDLNFSLRTWFSINQSQFKNFRRKKNPFMWNFAFHAGILPFPPVLSWLTRLNPLHHVLGNTHRPAAWNTWTNLWRKASERGTCHREQNDLKAERVLGKGIAFNFFLRAGFKC